MSGGAVRAEPSLLARCLAELMGTFLIVFFGCGAVHAAVLTGAQSGLWQVAIVWGVGIALAVYATADISGAHLNPAVTAALAVWGKCSGGVVVPYVLSQTLGAALAAAALFGIFEPHLAAKEKAKGVTRGQPGSVVTAMCYGEYFPNPGVLAAAEGPFNESEYRARKELMSQERTLFAEVLGTAILVFMIFAMTDARNASGPLANLAPAFIGLTVAALISVFAPLTQACFNPARDFGPRMFAYFAGWGSVAWPGLMDFGWLIVYIIAPTFGGCLGGGVYMVMRRSAGRDS